MDAIADEPRDMDAGRTDSGLSMQAQGCGTEKPVVRATGRLNVALSSATQSVSDAGIHSGPVVTLFPADASLRGAIVVVLHAGIISAFVRSRGDSRFATGA